MENFTFDEYKNAKEELEKTIIKCEVMFPKFKLGTSQHTLLINRINALTLCKDLIDKKISNNEELDQVYSIKDIDQSINPIESIIHKCKKAQSKYEIGSTHYNRYIKMINTMYVCKSLIENEMKK